MQMASGEPTRLSPRPAGALDPRLYTHPLLLMLVLAYASNFMDRTIVGTLAQAIKVDLKISDGQLGLLQGFAFVVLYSVMGLPIARLAERRDRVTIISACFAAWSVMTMLCGLAHGFIQLLVFRIGVGVGEAGCNAPSHAMIADAFPPEKRSRALSLYNIGGPLGTMIGAMMGGVIAEHISWRAAFLIVGAPGLILAAILRTVARDPGRGGAPANAATPSAPPPSVPARQVAAGLVKSPSLRHLILGFTFTSFAVAGIGSFSQPYYIRAFGLSYAQIGLIFGFFGGLAAGSSLLISGRLADWAVARDVRWHAWLPALGVAIAAPLACTAYLVGQWPVALMFGFGASLFVNWFIAPTLSAIHKIVGSRQVAMAMAMILMFQNFLGLGGGPFFTGVLIDALGRHAFAAHGLGDFLALCPGGAARPGAPAALAQACHAALTGATRLGILITVAFEGLAVLHFLLAARHLRQEIPAQMQA